MAVNSSQINVTDLDFDNISDNLKNYLKGQPKGQTPSVGDDTEKKQFEYLDLCETSFSIHENLCRAMGTKQNTFRCR